MTLSRRCFLASVSALPLLARPQKIIIAGGHPGDPECGCAGTIARYTALGHDVALFYLNRGEGYCGSASLDRCAAIRTAEAERACRILKARPLFAGQYDGRSVVDEAHYASFGRLLEQEAPDVVFTQWPLDRHPDHRTISLLTLDAWCKSKGKFALYYYEVADDTMAFTPNEFVDTSAVESLRHEACFAHASQNPQKWYPRQVELTRAHGQQRGFAQAEAFLRHQESKPGLLP